MILEIDDENRVRTLTLNRPDALNAFNEALYDATTGALRDAADDSQVAVVLLTGLGRAFRAGAPLPGEIRAARDRNNACFAELMGAQANAAALSAFTKPSRDTQD